LQQALIFRFRSAEAEALEPIVTAPFYGLPHHQIVGSQVLIISIRGAVLVNGLRAEMEVHGSRY
jgi:hypothetical protein